MSAKSNFTQAVQELMGRTAVETEESIQITEESTPLTEEIIPTPENPPYSEEAVVNEEKTIFFTQPEGLSTISNENNITTIAKGTIIVGEIRSDGDVNLQGDIKGTINTNGDLTIGGKVLGSLSGKDIELNGASVQGIITSSGNIFIDDASVVVGDINALSLQLSGKVKGNIVVINEASLAPNSILFGDITAKTITMNQAKVQGKISVSPQDDDIEIDLKNELIF